LTVSQVGTVISFLILRLAGQVWSLFFARILDGITGGNIIVAQAYVTDITPREKRTEALGYIFLSFGVGFILGPAIGGALASMFSYQAPYFFAAIAAAIVVILTWVFLEETVTDEQRAKNRQQRSNSLNITRMISNLPLISILLIAFGTQFAFAMLQSTFSLFGEAVLFADTPEWADLGIGIVLSMAGVGQIVTQLFLLRRLIKRYGESILVMSGGAIRFLAMAILVLIAVPMSAGLSLFLYALGTGMQLPALQSLVTNTVSDNERGAVLGMYQSSLSLAIIVGSAVSGTLFGVAPIFPYVVGAIVFGFMLIPAFFLMRWAKNQEEKTKRIPPLTVGD
jgi:DHA1 family tetracycline resistance protein-like MFS transporter